MAEPTTKSEPTPRRSPKRGGKMVGLAVVDEQPVWLEVNNEPVVTWMCTPELLEELAVGWLHGEGYISSLADLIRLRPCATEPGFWAEVAPPSIDAVRRENRKRVLASGCGAVTAFMADAATVPSVTALPAPPEPATLRSQFKQLFALGERYKTTGGIHAAALVDDDDLLYHAEDIGRHNAVDKVIGAAILDSRSLPGMGLLVTGRISAELAFKAARAGLPYVATPSVPSTIAADIGRRSGMLLIGRAVSGTPHVHLPKERE